MTTLDEVNAPENDAQTLTMLEAHYPAVTRMRATVAVLTGQLVASRRMNDGKRAELEAACSVWRSMAVASTAAIERVQEMCSGDGVVRMQDVRRALRGAPGRVVR